MALRPSLALLAPCLLAGCLAHGGAPKAEPEAPPPPPAYLGSEVTLMGGDLVQVKAQLKTARDDKGGAAEVEAYARCQLAGYALAHKAGYLRHIRTLDDKEGGVWRADAVYSVTSDKPAGQNTIDAAKAVRDCEKAAVPTGS